MNIDIRELALQGELTLDAYRTLFTAIFDIITELEPHHQNKLLAAIEESLVILNLASSP